ncbi:probable LRR receptor-like serine/threonine-protein kinase At3g47570 [Mercurialis annua]|uniref:probable LRR receptor-like serine/threonine-protein kinase At3g47570 n=1 Tax=Mercurialis annua TaxID=3986 RepID=UPI00215F3C5F|nr:probable LRR receptor-like serine/threonine-protein kinase At3g47570 [Mercurialis annua]
MKCNNSVSLVLILLCSVGLQCLKVDVVSENDNTDRLALLKFKEGISGDPNQVLNSWNDSLPFCSWFGIACSFRHQRVVSLVLEGQNLVGSISPYTGNLSFLRVINLQNNSLQGEVPQEVGRLFRLEEFLLNNNILQGEIPINLTGCSRLRMIGLQGNNLSGKIPAQLGSLFKLEVLSLSSNHLRGEIPAALGNLSFLKTFRVTYNRLVGIIPDDIGRRLTKLEIFHVGANQLSGIIPPTIFNISSLNVLVFTQNRFNGSLPESIDLPNLTFFGIGDNYLSGPIPNSLFNCSKLEIIDLGWNYFAGQVPTIVGNLKNLWRIRLHGNDLGSNSSNDLAFVTSLNNCTKLKILDFGRNNFGGVLPNSVANLSTELTLFYFGGNEIGGVIPDGLENLINLVGLVMNYNLITGIVPSYFGKFQKLQILDFFGNRLSGQIPTSLSNLTRLTMLYLSRNLFEGTIPSGIGNLENLIVLAIAHNNLIGTIPHEILGLTSLSQAIDLSHNSLTGNLPPEIGKLISLTAFFVSGNNLSGEIPREIGNCLSLEFLEMQDNAFQGTLPSSLTSLKSLQYLDLSGNNLTGRIPEGLQDMEYLIHLNLSYNNLEGELPTEGIFRNASAILLTGNNKLCGGIPELNLSKCPKKVLKKGKSLNLKLAIIIPCVSICVIFILAFFLMHRKRKFDKDSSSSSLMMNHILPKISYRDLYKATNGFSSDNLIGSGGFGYVYKGLLDEVEGPVAVKVLKLEQKGASKSFIAECKVLLNIRHRNLVKMLTFCSSIDEKLNEFKALVFEFMVNGSLEMWLHSDSSRGNQASFLQRLDIAIDIASALHYLHDLCERPIIHCDLKPSNVLLDDHMVAHVCDFGQATFLSPSNESSQSRSVTTGIKGTVGYAAPEYGMGCPASKEGDVYSYGILLLELFSRRRPTDEMFEDGFDLREFVKAALPQQLMQNVDHRLLALEMDQSNAVTSTDQNIIGECEYTKIENFVLSILVIGLNCSSRSPRDRMSAKDVIGQLHLIKNAFLDGSPA